MRLKKKKIYRGDFFVSGINHENALSGYLFIDDSGDFFVTVDLPRFVYHDETIGLISGELTHEKAYINLINCTIFKSEGIEVTFAVEEITYSRSLLSNDECFKKISFEVRGLDYFFKERVVDVNVERNPFSHSFKTKEPIVINIYNDLLLNVKLKKSPNVQLGSHSVSVHDVYLVEIDTIKLNVKQSLFENAGIVADVISLTSFNPPLFGNLVFENDTHEMACVTSGYYALEDQQPLMFPMLELTEINNALSNAYKLFKENDSLRKIRDIIQGSSNSLNHIDSFLNFSRGIEYFSTSFLINESKKVEWKNDEERLLFSRLTGLKKDLDKPRKLTCFFRAVQFLEGTQLYSDYLSKEDFLLKLNDTRNHYTHLKPTNTLIWTNNQIKELNPYLKIFSLLLLWRLIGLDVKLLDRAYNRAKGFIKHHSLHENPNSVHFNGTLSAVEREEN